MFTIKNLKAQTIDGISILNGINLEVRPGEVHAIMGPNGSGKSTLAKTIAGHPNYEVIEGSVEYEINLKKRNILEMEPHERSGLGVMISFQYPIEIPGVSNLEFLKLAYNSICEAQGLPQMDSYDFKSFAEEKAQLLNIPESFLAREVNVGFSGGEKKRNEILQIALLTPKVALLDETDSGLDIDALKTVADGINKIRSKDNAFILITHYHRLLQYVEPDYIHILFKGKIVKTGGPELALKIEAKGYEENL